jgi:hypothetical protein
VAVRNEEKCLKGEGFGVMLVRGVMKVGKQGRATKEVRRYGMAFCLNLINLRLDICFRNEFDCVEISFCGVTAIAYQPLHSRI